ncbi:MAG TPA: deoxyribonuclease V [Blastocatellia bacterium]|nr:deoxyribonuclease V [Blastocatellia bacterium]
MAPNPINQLHAWDLTPAEAIALQKKLREQVVIRPLPDKVELVAGADISFNKFSEVVYAGIVVLRLPQLEVIATSGVVTTTKFPYIPGLLSFREVPALLEAWQKLTVRPDVLVLDGQGIAHPRRLGIASHIGLVIGLPTVGCAKTVLTGRYEEPDPQAGSWSPMTDKGETIGAALRTKDRVNPVFISPGHLADIPSAITLALRCVRGYAEHNTSGGLFGTRPEPSRSKGSKYRIPEPTRLAHLFVNAMRRGEEWVPPKV